MSVYALDFGTTRKGRPTHLYRMKNARGMEVDITDLGASIVAVRLPAEDGKLVDVALGFDDVHCYEKNPDYMGGIVGRCANRIAGASFELAGSTHTLTANDGENSLHGGRDPWNERLWEGVVIGRKGARRKGAHADTVIFGLFSDDDDQGYPGEVDVRVTYKLTDDNELKIVYDAQPSIKTLINLTSHAYWNLNGHDSGDVRSHLLRVDASRYTPVDDALIPTGEVARVEGTPLDFCEAKPIEQSLDHNFMLNDAGHMREVATLVGDKTGLSLTIATDLPAMQVYTGEFIREAPAKDGATYGPFAGVALETQYAPDAIHHKKFSKPIFTPEEPYCSKTVLTFGGLAEVQTQA
ncbi:MAG: aldose epimerase family protein, partial [Coriobacteriales bacterium]|nr:aldose epimerase family protein [Coriobacteriales bacterium]